MASRPPPSSQDNVLLYESVASDIRTAIKNGAYRPGEKLPSLRRLHQKLGVSIATVTQAYVVLENQGWVEVRPQSGYFARIPAASLPPMPAPSRPSSVITKVDVVSLHRTMIEQARRKDVIQFGTAVPDPEALPHAALTAIAGRISRTFKGASNAYELPPGNDKLRREIVRRAAESGCVVHPDEVVITCGAAEALHVSLRAVTKPGDIVAVESPTYFGILEVLESLGLQALEISCSSETGINVDELRHAAKRHSIRCCVVMPNFHNPLGALMPIEHKEALVDFISKHDIPLIEDDVYGDLGYEVARPRPLRSFDKKQLILWCGSFSKTIAPGFRVGWVAPGRFFDRVMDLKIMTSVASPTLSQLVIAEFLKHGGYERHLRTLRQRYETQVLETMGAIARSFPDGTSLCRPQGGFVLWVEFPRGVNALALAERCRARKVSISPGDLFSTSKRFKNCIRLNCGYAWSKARARGIEIVAEEAEKAVRLRDRE